MNSNENREQVLRAAALRTNGLDDDTNIFAISLFKLVRVCFPQYECVYIEQEVSEVRQVGGVLNTSPTLTPTLSGWRRQAEVSFCGETGSLRFQVSVQINHHRQIVQQSSRNKTI